MNDSSRSPFGVLLRRFRTSAGFSQEDLAERSSLSVASVSALERGARRAPYADTTAALAKALSLTPAQRTRFYEAAKARRRMKAAGSPARSTVPVYSTSFVGREEACRDLAALF